MRRRQTRDRALARTYSISWGLWREKGCVTRHYAGDFKYDLLHIEGSPILLSAFLSRRRRHR